MNKPSLLLYKVNAFTTKPNQGNPAGVAINPPPLTEDQMKWISNYLRVSETAYLHQTQPNHYLIRFFSPTTEVDLCGHATIATYHTLYTTNQLPTTTTPIIITQHTKAGSLSVEIHPKTNQPPLILMHQNTPTLQDISISWKHIIDALNIQKNDIDTTLPLQKTSTGLYTLPIHIPSLTTLQSLTPNFTKIQTLCETYQVGSWHLFSFETKEPTSTYHARNFAPSYGINEDPVTGTANGATSYYLWHHNLIKTTSLTAEQGDTLNRPGRVNIHLEKHLVKVGGNAYIQQQENIQLKVS